MFFYVVVYNIVLMTVYQKKKKKNLNKVNKNGLIKEKENFFWKYVLYIQYFEIMMRMCSKFL